MKISFFEEFPTPDSLEKIKYINFDTKIYIAAYSIDEFYKFVKEIKLPLVYWIVLKKHEGYWISPFAKRNALIRVLNEVWNENIEVMLDLENPVIAPWLHITQLHNFIKNKKFIYKFINESRPTITAVELSGNDKKLKFWGLSYDSDKIYVAKMVYTSLIIGKREKKIEILKKVCADGVKKYGDRFKICLGCIAKGVSGIEPILQPQELKEDLLIAKEIGVKEAIIFRLAGLNKDYINAINYAKN